MPSNDQSVIRHKKIKSRMANYEIHKSFISSKDLFIILCGIIISRGNFTSYLMPFGYALFGYILYYDKRKWWLGVSILLGIFSTGEYMIVTKNIIIYFVMTFGYIRLYKKITKKWQVGLLVSCSVIMVGVVMNIFRSNYLFDTALVIVEGLLSFSLFYIYLTAMNLFINRNRKLYSNQEIVCLAIFVSILILGLNNLMLYKFSVSTILSVFIILLFSNEIGVGVSAPLGMTLGLVLNLSTNSNPLFIVVYGLCGIISGLFKEMGKVAVVIGFILSNAMLAFYLNGSTEVFIRIEEILIAAIMFLVIPSSTWDKVNFFNYDKVDESYQGFCKERINEGLRKKLNKYAILLNQMGTSFFDTDDNVFYKEIYDKALERITDSICKECYLVSRCWKTDAENTYNMIIDVVEELENNDAYQDKNISNFKNKCIHDEQVLVLLKSEIRYITLEKEMSIRIKENNQLISNQLKFTGQLLDDLKTNLSDKWLIKSEEERDIRIELDKNDINIHNIFVVQERNGRYKVTITSTKELNDYIGKDIIPRLVSNILNTKMILEEDLCSYDNRGGCLLTYSELSQYRVSTGLVRFSSKKDEQSGDIFSDKILDNGSRILALCDGMGVGDNAYQESDTTMNLLEKFMEAEIDKTIMVKTINSILMLRNEKEVFSTLDYIVFDQFTGEAEFNKIGAAITLVIKNGEVKLIRGQSLPVGILEEIRIESISMKLNQGDLIIMMTDGIFECYDNPEKVELWVINTINKITSKNPQKIADELYNHFISICHEPSDDITILVGKVWCT
ncbi:stage II sporulation protein E [Alkalibaculum sporogenes]|nr:stage II sporulation protein E [Alkalibaculum sporogenes]